MCDETAFLQAVLSEPHDLAHRLVYADWLDDQGGPAQHDRATFIRSQIERETLHPSHPRARTLLAEEKTLLSRRERVWAEDVAPLVERWGFHYGFIEEAVVPCDQVLTLLSQLAQVAPLRRLRIRRASLLADGTADGEAKQCAVALGRIHRIDLGRGTPGQQAVLLLASLPLPRLEDLSLGWAMLTTAELPPLAASGLLGQLRSLAVRSISADAVQSLAHSGRLVRLGSLSLNGAHLGDRVVPLLAGSPLAGNLHTLGLGHNHLTPTGLRDLTASPLAAGLESLDLGFNHLGVEGARLLASASFPRLRHLNLTRTGLGDEGAAVLADSPLLGQLQSLDLSLNGVGVAGARALARTRQSSRLWLLDLVYNAAMEPTGRSALLERFGASVCLFDREI